MVTLTGCKDLAGKHPVSALTELCSKRRWGPPIFSQAFDCGPPHKKQFVYKVTGTMIFQPDRLLSSQISGQSSNPVYMAYSQVLYLRTYTNLLHFLSRLYFQAFFAMSKICV